MIYSETNSTSCLKCRQKSVMNLKNEAKNVIDDLISNIDSDVYVSDKMVELFRKTC